MYIVCEYLYTATPTKVFLLKTKKKLDSNHHISIGFAQRLITMRSIVKSDNLIILLPYSNYQKIVFLLKTQF